MKFKSILVGMSLVASSLAAFAQASAAAFSSGTTQATTVAASMTEGEVRKVDKDTRKITLKHGEIKNLDMPGMTMVFQVKDPAMLDAVKQGDKVQFKVERSGGALVITEMQVGK